MKRTILKMLFLIAITSLHAQVAINTNIPQGVFHIDAKGNTSGALNVTDDVIVSTNGHLGIGTPIPSAKVESVGSSTVAPLRITDGKQASDYILTSDDDGNASWIEKPSPGGVIYRILGAVVTYNAGVYSLVYSVPITVSGNYLVSIRWWGYSLAVVNKSICGIFYATTSSNNVSNWVADQPYIKDQVEYCVNCLVKDAISFSTTLFAKAVKGQYLKLYLNVSVGGDWVIGGSSITQPTWNPSIIVFRV